MTRVAIMQPTYLSWIGYFGLMRSVDVFILLDNVQFARRSWQQRNQIKTPAGASWLTVPVMSKGLRDQKIYEVQIDLSRDFPGSHVRALELNYRKSDYYGEYHERINEILTRGHQQLADLTAELIEALRDILGIPTVIRRASEFGVSGAKAELLADICAQLGAAEYVSAPGSMDYLEESDAFARRNIPYRYFRFDHPVYSQRFGDFVPYMSVVDLVFNCGPRSLQVIESGIEMEKVCAGSR